MEVEIPKVTPESPSLLEALNTAETQLVTKYAEKPIQSLDEARRDAANYAGLQFGWYAVAEHFQSEEVMAEDLNVELFSNLETAIRGAATHNWQPMKTLLLKYAQESLQADEEDPDQIMRSTAFANLANSI